jgi:hypothetical protein
MAEPKESLPTLLQQRIIETADEYHNIAEDQWAQAIELAPESEDAEFEFRRLIRAALVFYARAFLVLDLVETDETQQLEEVLDLVAEQEPEFQAFFDKNNVYQVLDEDGMTTLSQAFAVAEALRVMLLQYSTQMAATLGTRF